MNRVMLTLAASMTLCAQDAIQGPVVGWTYESASASLRAVQGIPGSSVLGARAGKDLRRAVTAPGGAFALATTGESHDAVLIDLRSGAEPRKLDVPAGVSDFFLSPRATTAVLLYRESGRAILLAGLPADPAVALEFETPASSLAVSDDARGVIAMEPDGIRMFDGDGNQWLLNHPYATRSATFLEGSHDALLAGEKGVWLLREVTGNAAGEQIWEGDALAATLERNTAVVIDRDSGLIALNLQDRTSQRLACACTPIALTRMSQSVYRVNELAAGPLWLVDLNGPAPRAVFVPADAKLDE